MRRPLVRSRLLCLLAVWLVVGVLTACDGGSSSPVEVAADAGDDVGAGGVPQPDGLDSDVAAWSAALPGDATLDDPILLTFAAARARAAYLLDEGYTLARQPGGGLAFATDSAGDLGLALDVEGEVRLLGAGEGSGPFLRTTTSDGVRFEMSLPEGALTVTFVATTSRVATVEIVLERARRDDRPVAVIGFLRRCAGFDGVGDFAGGVAARHTVDIPTELKAIGAGTYVETVADALVVDGAIGEPWFGLAACGEAPGLDLAAAIAAGERPEGAALLAVRAALGAEGRVSFRRVVALPDEGAEGLRDALAAASGTDSDALLAAGEARLAQIPPLVGLSRDEQAVYRSSFALLDQAMLPAEGLRETDYYVFAREPTWWFGRLGQHLHESLAMVLMARFDPEAALASQWNFVRRVEDDGYLPYNIGPVVEQTIVRTASPPLLSYVSDAIEREVGGDAAFLAAAYEAGVRCHRFWTDQRDRDGDGFVEWGGFPITESVRDLENVIWEEVAPPNQVESLDANVWLVMEEQALARMARRLGQDDEADEWETRATDRAARVNDTFWDPATGFYYHVAYADNGFTHRQPHDLKRMEIAGFLPLVAGIVPADRLPGLLQKLYDPELFWREGGVAGLAATDPFYDPAASSCCRWRGPVWVQWQWWIARALRDLGETARADELTNRVVAAVTAQLRAVHQFREIYDADDPTAHNDSMPNYVWTALAAGMLLDRAEWRPE